MDVAHFTLMERELAAIIVGALDLEMAPEDIQAGEALFGEGLGLDSIDALELSLEIAKRYGVEIKAEDERNEQIFASLGKLAAYVGQHRTK